MQYYRVQLGFGDHLIVDTTNITSTANTDVCVMDPGVTDYTVANASCITERETDFTTKKDELTYIAPSANNYLLVFHSDNCCGMSWGYSAIVSVLHSSTVSAGGPQTVEVGHKVKVTGQANVPGAVTLQLKAGGWQNVAQGNTKSDGMFKFAYKATRVGLYKFRVLFGATGYLGSKSTKVKVRVHG